MLRNALFAFVVAVSAGGTVLEFSDHGDTPLLIGAGRHDARLTDLHVFTNGDRLVLALSLDPSIPPGVTNYTFASDLRLDICIDNHSPVDFGDPQSLATYGGRLLAPAAVSDDIRFGVRFKAGAPVLSVAGLPNSVLDRVQVFTGLRDDPFIRGPRIGRNVVAVVLEMPLALVLDQQPTLLVWATSRVPGLGGPFQDLVGRSLRSMFPENDAMNGLRPNQHHTVLGLVPDVVIFDTTRPAVYPNGHHLVDDVVDLVGDPRVLMNDAPFPSANDVPFLNVFPYLAPPQ